MKFKFTKDDAILLREILSNEQFRKSVISKIGKPTRVEVMLDKGVVEFSSPNRTRVKTMNIEVLLAHAKGEVH